MRSAARFVADALASLDAEVPGLLLRVSRQTDGEAIHDFRVNVRRTRTLLAVARPLLGRHYVLALRSTYANLGRATGELRDAEVLRELVAKHGAALGTEFTDALRRLDASLEERERELRAASLAELSTGDVTAVRGTLGALLALPVRPRRDRELSTFARRAVLRSHERIEAARRIDGPGDVEGLHALRIAFKRHRYTLELFRAVLPPDLSASYDSSVRFQKRLGDLNDLAVGAGALQRAGADERLAAALLDGLEVERRRRSLALWAELCPGRDA